MDKPLLSPTNDFVFKKIFAEHDTVLIDFLKSVLDVPAEDYQGLVIVDPHIRRESVEDKEAVLDVKIRLRDGRDIDVEIQVKTQPAIWKRIQYYTADMYVAQIKKGRDYHLLTDAVSILITDFILIKEDDRSHHRFRFYDTAAGLLLPDSIEIHTLEIHKRRADDETDLGHWLAFFAAQTPEDFMTASAQNGAIAQAYGILKTLSADEEARLLAESREKGRRDAADRLRGARQEGRQEGKLEVARSALRKNLPIEMIVDLTGLSASEIQSLRNL